MSADNVSTVFSKSRWYMIDLLFLEEGYCYNKIEVATRQH